MKGDQRHFYAAGAKGMPLVSVSTDEERHARNSAVVKFDSIHFGRLEVAEDKVIVFASGLLGLPVAKRFVMLDEKEDAPFLWLQSVDEPALAFIIMDPLVIKGDYKINLKRHDVSDLGEPKEDDLVVLVILTAHDGDDIRMTANLKAPLIINTSTMKGKQIVLQDDGYQIQYPVF